MGDEAVRPSRRSRSSNSRPEPDSKYFKFDPFFDSTKFCCRTTCPFATVIANQGCRSGCDMDACGAWYLGCLFTNFFWRQKEHCGPKHQEACQKAEEEKERIRAEKKAAVGDPIAGVPGDDGGAAAPRYGSTGGAAS